MTIRYSMRAALAAFSLLAFAATAQAACYDPLPLKFRDDGMFRILQITDTQDDQFVDFRTPALVKKAIEEERPDLVVCTGDCITGGEIRSDEDVRTAIDAVFNVIEEAGIPFMVVFGNHDEDAYARGDAPRSSEAEQLEYYRNNFSCNINKEDNPNVTGDGDMAILVYESQKTRQQRRADLRDNGKPDDGKLVPKLAVWGIDSGRYAPNPIAGQRINYNDNTWDYIREDQVDWYRGTSRWLEQRYGRKIPGIMFFHIPLFEFEMMWTIDQGMFPSGDRPNEQPPVDEGRYFVEEERNECVCTGPFNSGLFAAAQDRGDIMGMFVGHDHINNYVGNYHGILLGYGASSGFGPYGFGGDERNRLRGVRVHDFNEDDVENYAVYMQTYFKKAGDDYGMCLAPDPEDCNGDAFYPWTPPVADAATTSFAAVTASAALAPASDGDGVEMEMKSGAGAVEDMEPVLRSPEKDDNGGDQ